MSLVSIEELEAEALKLNPRERARLAGNLMESLEDLSDEESARIWGGRRHSAAPPTGTFTKGAAAAPSVRSSVTPARS